MPLASNVRVDGGGDGLIGLIPEHYQNCFHNSDQIIAQQGPLTAGHTQLSPLGGFHIYSLRGDNLYETSLYTDQLKVEVFL